MYTILFSSPDANETTPLLHAPDSKVLISSDCVIVCMCVHNHTCQAVYFCDSTAFSVGTLFIVGTAPVPLQ